MTIVNSMSSDVLNRLELVYLAIIPAIKNFPKDQKYTLGENIDQALLGAIRDFFTASYDKRVRENALIHLRGQLHETVFLIRVAFKLKFLSNALYEKFTKELVEIGKIISSWIKKGNMG